MTHKILIDGIGTVGSRIAHLLLSSSDVEIHASKRSVTVGDRRTQELLDLYARFNPFPIYVSAGSNQYTRIQNFRKLGLSAHSHLDVSGYDAIINATSGDTTLSKIAEYKAAQKLFLVQGGTPYDVMGHDFLSVPSAVGKRLFTNFKSVSARNPSCNTTFSATALGLVLQQVASEQILRVLGEYFRRSRDPGENKPLVDTHDLVSSHHAADVMHALPILAGKVESVANKNSWEHFHYSRITIDFKEHVALEPIVEAFRNYDRCVLLDHDITKGKQDIRGGIEIILEASNDLGIVDGDTLLPIYYVEQSSPTQIVISGFTPQRSIVSLSNIDWLWLNLGFSTTYEQAYEKTNKLLWFSNPVEELRTRLYERITARLVPSIER